jgi:hypothetical protein
MTILRKLLVITPAIAGAIALMAPHVIAKTGLGPLPPLLPVTLPAYEDVEVTYLEQGWTRDEAQWFYHATQGGAFEIPVPYEWFVNLEVGALRPLWWMRAERLIDESYLGRFGFLPNDSVRYVASRLSPGWESPLASTLQQDTLNNPDRLPVGFARSTSYPDRRYSPGGAGEVGRVIPNVVGFNCSLCHTAQLNFRGRGLRIEGGPAMVDLGQFEKAVGNALYLTRIEPFRFHRFAARVLGPEHTEAEEIALKVDLQDFLVRGDSLQRALLARGIYPTPEGFSRLDAIGRIGNFVLGEELADKGRATHDYNLAVANAPVTFPHIWDTPWFEWVQYNASFKLPIMRNAGEAMGVFAAANLVTLDHPDSLFSSSINLPNLIEFESLIRGSQAFGGLRAPEWPDFFPPIDRALAELGDSLYVENCQGCHLPAFDRPDAILADTFWVSDVERRYLRLNVVNLHAIGTDPTAAVNMATRMVQLGPLGEAFKDGVKRHGWVGMDSLGMGGMVPFGVALPFVISQTVNKKAAELGFPTGIAGGPDVERTGPLIQAPLGYKARPLNGVWATPPYLHNGSVRNIYELLGPEEDRATTFWLGTREYDPERLGYVTDTIEGGFLFDTRLTGNSNRGHHFTGPANSWQSGRSGVIGRALSPEERMAIIEYLKTLPAVPRMTAPTD